MLSKHIKFILPLAVQTTSLVFGSLQTALIAIVNTTFVCSVSGKYLQQQSLVASVEQTITACT